MGADLFIVKDLDMSSECLRRDDERQASLSLTGDSHEWEARFCDGSLSINEKGLDELAVITVLAMMS